MALLVLGSVAAVVWWAWSAWSGLEAQVDQARSGESQADSVVAEVLPLTLRLSQHPSADPARLWTRVHIQGHIEPVDFPFGWQAEEGRPPAFVASYEATVEAFRAEAVEVLAAQLKARWTGAGSGPEGTSVHLRFVPGFDAQRIEDLVEVLGDLGLTEIVREELPVAPSPR